MRHDPDPLLGLKSQPAGYSFHTDYYEQSQIIYVTRGSLTLRGHGRLRAASVLLLPFGSAFDLISAGGYEGVFRLSARPEDLAELESAQWHPADRGLQDTASILLREMTSPGRVADDTLGAIGTLFRLFALRTAEERGDESSSEIYGTASEKAAFWTRTVCQVIDSHLYSNRELQSVLSGLGRSYRHLSRCFTAQMGRSPKAYQIERRVEEAQRLLSTTSMSITDIAMELGYPSSQHFSSQFRRVVGRSPRELRRRHL
jgi:AraC-like DNA-binding protein